MRTGCFARPGSSRNSPKPCSTPSKFRAGRPSPTWERVQAITAFVWPGVGPKGTVLATDLQPECSRCCGKTPQAAGVTNIKPLLATQKDTRLPEGKVDLILMVDVYHECTDPETFLQDMKKALRPGGRLVLVEFRGEDPAVPIKPEHKMTLKQVRREVEPHGLTFKNSLEFLPWQHVIIFEKPAPGAAKKRRSRPTRRPGSQRRCREDAMSMCEDRPEDHVRRSRLVSPRARRRSHATTSRFLNSAGTPSSAMSTPTSMLVLVSSAISDDGRRRPGRWTSPAGRA